MPFLDDYVGAPQAAPKEFRAAPSLFAANEGASRDKISSHFRDSHRPFLDPWGYPAILVNTGKWTRDGKGGRSPIRQQARIKDLLNAPRMPGRLVDQVPLWALNAATLRPEQWAEIDRKVIKASRQPLVAYEDMRKASSYGGFDAYGRMYLEYQAMSDPGEAVEDFDLMTQGRHDQPLFLNRATPLPCTHADFFFSDRFMQISGNDGYESIDTLTGEAMSARVSERIEDVTIGTVTGATYGTQTAGSHTHQGTSTVYGLTSFTYRSTKTNLTTPTGANPNATIVDIADMIQTLNDNAFYGPFTLYLSRPWNEFLVQPYAYTNGSNWATAPSMNLQQALEAIPNIDSVKVLPRLSSGFQAILVDWKKAGRAIDGRTPTVLQWDSMGGMRHNFKVWAIQVPQFLAEYSTNAAILHATTS